MTALDGKRRFGRAKVTGGGGLGRTDAAEAASIEVRTRFPRSLIALIDREAAGLGMLRHQWVAALVRHRLTGKPYLPRPEELTLFQMHSELRRARTELLMIRRELIDTGQLSSADLLAAIDRHATAQQAAMGAIREAVDGNLAYWRTPP